MQKCATVSFITRTVSFNNVSGPPCTNRVCVFLLENYVTRHQYLAAGPLFQGKIVPYSLKILQHNDQTTYKAIPGFRRAQQRLVVLLWNPCGPIRKETSRVGR